MMSEELIKSILKEKEDEIIKIKSMIEKKQTDLITLKKEIPHLIMVNNVHQGQIDVLKQLLAKK